MRRELTSNLDIYIPHTLTKFYAGTEDFVNRVINVTFEADESRSSSVLSVLVAIPVINDDVNEATEVFAVKLVLTDSVNPDMITLSSPAASLCTIVDDDRESCSSLTFTTISSISSYCSN